MSTKVLLVGNQGSGKTTYVKALTNQILDKKYIATVGADVTNFSLGDQTFSLWDTAGQEKLGGVRYSYYSGAQRCLIFTTANDLNSITKWENEVRSVVPNIPIVVVISKTDCYPVSDTLRNSLLARHINFCEISSKLGLNLLTPL